MELNSKGFPLHTKAFLRYPGVSPLLLYAGTLDSYSGFSLVILKHYVDQAVLELIESPLLLPSQ